MFALSASPSTARPVLRVTELGVERQCNACREWWPLDDEFFYRRLSGYQGRCKACVNEARPVGDHHRERAA